MARSSRHSRVEQVWSFPMTIHLMAHSAMPFPILGSVHFSNTSRFLDRQALAGAPKVDVCAKVEGVEPHRRGRSPGKIERSWWTQM